ncbi:MAG: cell division protein SepF [Lachnospiraceae bacterium]|nr:cell division protein SepF [Lachnospiraceae bacterium]
MAFVDKFINYMKIGDDGTNDEYDDYDDYEEDPVTVEHTQDNEDESNKFKSISKATPFSKPRKPINLSDVSVCVFKPQSVSESREIMATFKENKTIVLNLEDSDSVTAQRTLDFISGCCFALGGNLQKISNYIFIATPASVDISGDLQDTLAASFDM